MQLLIGDQHNLSVKFAERSLAVIWMLRSISRRHPETRRSSAEWGISRAPMKSSDVAVRFVTSDLAFHSPAIRSWFQPRGIGNGSDGDN